MFQSFFGLSGKKIRSLLLVLIIVISFIYSFGIAKYLILGSMRLDYPQTIIDSDTDSEFVSHGEALLDTLKSWSKVLRGKKPIYTTTGGSQISIDSIGDEKSIKLFKPF